MTNAVILRENRDGIEILTFNRPDKLNALNPEVMDALDRILPDLESNSSIRAVILRGAGEKSFVTGADIPQFLGFGPLEANLFATLFASEDQKEGARAFLEKRAPNFKNR